MGVTAQLTTLTYVTDISELSAVAQGFRLSLEARNKAKNTVTIYLDAVERFGRFLTEQGMPTTLAGIRREHVESWIASLLAERSPATALNRYKSLQAFFKWCVDEDEITVSPMARMHQPTVPDNAPPVLEQEQLRDLVAVCEGRGLIERRDKALLLVLMDCGLRRAEVAGLQVADVDLGLRTLRVTGKGNRTRTLQMGVKTAQAVERYLRIRPTHPHAASASLWLGERGGMGVWGIRDIVERRGKQAGIAKIHPHLFRHTWAHEWLDSDGNESDLMVNAGWRSPDMVRHYGRSKAEKRARQAQSRHSLADRL